MIARRLLQLPLKRDALMKKSVIGFLVFIGVFLLPSAAEALRYKGDPSEIAACYHGCMDKNRDEPGLLADIVYMPDYCVCICGIMINTFTEDEQSALAAFGDGVKLAFGLPKEKVLKTTLYCVKKTLRTAAPKKEYAKKEKKKEKPPVKKEVRLSVSEAVCIGLAHDIARNEHADENERTFKRFGCPEKYIKEAYEKKYERFKPGKNRPNVQKEKSASRPVKEEKKQEKEPYDWNRFFEEPAAPARPKLPEPKPKKNDEIDRAVVFADIDRAAAGSIKPSVLGSFYRGLHDGGVELFSGGLFLDPKDKEYEKKREEIDGRSFSSFRPELKEHFSYKFGVFSFYVFIILFCAASVYAFIADAKTKKK